jgi:hypothetical protein
VEAIGVSDGTYSEDMQLAETARLGALTLGY